MHADTTTPVATRVLPPAPHRVWIARCYYDDFIAHPGWWAMIERPTVLVGERLRFDLDGAPAGMPAALDVVVTAIDAPDNDRETFGGWWILRYEPLAGAT